MLCCGCRREPRPPRIIGEVAYAAYPQIQYIQTAPPPGEGIVRVQGAAPATVMVNPATGTATIRRVHYPPDQYVQTYAPFRRPEMILQPESFRKVSGISSEMFRQIEAVEKQYDPTTATLIEAVERRGQMVARM